ncbi:MAG: DNA mismatch repair endonuclease MutL [Rickettsia endosymbiont of Bryobia graminum]|nr:DNA mismatch repair endonuclease MutL [Rickettsia endosymbiont of Bryobia graminum]
MTVKIKFLQINTINRIAAGEVIERPASVVKELVENAVDAGSSKIDVILEQAGKNLIVISDNGIGMSEEDLKIAVERHTTSKLDESDLLNINSFGFRGEALPSIGSISKMTITSRLRDHDKAYQIKLNSGVDKETKLAVHNEGTKIEIRDLFFATPARLKFLRSDKSELAASVDIVKKIALAHPQISISLSHDDRNIFKLKGQDGDYQDILKQRIVDIMGGSFIENASEVNLQRPQLSIYGFTSIPTFNRASAEDQFLFVNNRPVKDKLLQVALRVAYQDYLARDRHPVSVLFIKIDPQLVDVNVHPAKIEVRFHDPNTIRGLLISAIKDALASKSHIVSTNIAATTLGLFRSNNNSVPSKNFNMISDSTRSSYKFQDITAHNFQKQQLITTVPHAKVEIQENNLVQYSSSRPNVNESGDFRRLPQDYTSSRNDKLLMDSSVRGNDINDLNDANNVKNHYPLGAARAQLHSTYIVSQTEDSMIIVDQHAAHERLGYEKIKKTIENGGLLRQRLLIPEIIELPDEKRANLLYNAKDDLIELGLTIEKFSDKSIIVSEVPSLLEGVNINKLIQDLADNLSDMGENISLIQLIEHVTETYACHYSIRAGRKLLPEEMNALLRQMENTPFSGQCNHGRPTYIELKLKDIERLFGRR